MTFLHAAKRQHTVLDFYFLLFYNILFFHVHCRLLTFDGKYWKLYPLPNKTIVRSVEIGADNKIYVGGQDEFGYFTPSMNGQLTYHSLVKYVKESDRDFADVWDISKFKKSNEY